LKFIDEAKIYVRSGDGGNGCLSFRREPFKPMGGPDGGDGGKGGDVLVTATARCHSLLDFRYRQHFRGSKGGNGQGNDRHGKKGADVRLLVPLGTLIREAESGKILADLTDEGQTVTVARGGRGGKGNKHFATSTHRTPRFAQKGEAGLEIRLHLELKLLAQVGLVGLPNAGKSTLLSKVSAAKPKISDYPFTTLSPNLGVLENNRGERITMADIPGIIEGASAGAGLGLRFLRHIERTVLLVYLLDGSLPEAGAIQSFRTLREEIKIFNPTLADKPSVIAVNKMDLPQSQSQFRKIKKVLQGYHFPVIPISAINGEGILELTQEITSKVEPIDHGCSKGNRRNPQEFN
jgi:GTPase